MQQYTARSLLLLGASLVAGCLLPQTAPAQYSAGMEVEVESFGKWYPGKVTRLTGTGWPFVKYSDPKFGARESLFPPQRVRRAQPKQLDKIQRVRKWTTADGTFSVNASLQAILGDNVRLKREDDGSLITVPLAKLGASDQNFVALARKAMGNSELPTSSNADPSATPTAPAPPSDPLAALPVGKTEQAKMIAVTPTALGMFVPDAGVAETVPEIAIARPFPTDKSDFHDDIDVCLSHTYRTAAVTAFNTFIERESKTVTLHHLPTARQVAQGKMGRNVRLLSVSDRGDEIITTTGWPAAKVDAIQIWTAKDGAITATGGWRSAASRAVGIRDAQFLPRNQLLMSAGGFGVIWDVASATALHSFEMASDAIPALSANRRNIAFIGKDSHIYIIDVATSKAVRAIPLPDSTIKQLAFDNSGTRLAGSGRQQVIVWDLEKSSVAAQCGLVSASGTGRVRWAGDDFVILGDGKMIHLPSGATVWKYTMPKWCQMLRGGQMLAVQWSQGGGRLKPIVVPHAQVEAQAAGLTREQLIWVEPGAAKLTLGQVFVGPEQVRSELQKRLTAAGFTLSADGDLQIEISSERGETKTEGVKDFFSGPFASATGQITFTPTTIHAKVTYKGHTIYDSHRTYTVPGTIRLEKGETPQAAATRYCTPSISSYAGVFIPGAGPLLPDGKQYFGTSPLFGPIQ